MLSNRSLGVLVVILWLVVFVSLKPFSGDSHQRTIQKVKTIFPELAEQLPDIKKIIISDVDSSVTLIRDLDNSFYPDGRWVVQSKNHPVNYDKLMYLIDRMKELKGYDIVSVNPNNHGVYGVSEDQGTRIKFFDGSGELLVDWIAGAIRSQDIAGGDKPVFEYYMRPASSSSVYLAGDAIQPSADPLSWCDVNFLKGIESSKIVSIRRYDFEHNQNWTISRTSLDSKEWTLENGELIDSFAGESLAFTCSQLQASDVIGLIDKDISLKECGFPLDRFEVQVGDIPFIFELGVPAREGHRYLRIEGLPHIYTLSHFEVSQIRQTVDSLIKVD